MVVSNFICNSCANINICKAYAGLKKFSMDDCKEPFPTDISIDECGNYKQSAEFNTDMNED